MGASEVGPLVGERKPLGKTPLGNPSPEMTYLPTSLWSEPLINQHFCRLLTCIFLAARKHTSEA